MKKIKLVILPLLVFLFCQNAEGQGVRRWVISSFGDAGSTGGIRMSCTTAQPPNAGTIQNGGYFLRQGFQQPPDVEEINPDCIDAPMAEFIADYTIDACGQYFFFQYAGVPDSATTYLWDFGPDAVPATSTEANPTGIVFTSTGQKSIRLEVQTDSCIFTSTTNVEVTQTSLAASSDVVDVVCAANPKGVIRLEPLNGEEPFDYKWSNGKITQEVDNLSAGTYSFTVTDGSGCSYSTEVEVNGPDSIRVDFITSPETCFDEQNGSIDATVSGGVEPYFFQWSNGATSKDLNNISGEDYALAVIDANNCQSNFRVEIPITCEEFIFDNLITPNGDGANDAWVIANVTDFPNSELEIFNRWGDKVFYQKAYDNSWQGTNNSNEPLPVGAYYYVLHLNNKANTVFSGSISILR